MNRSPPRHTLSPYTTLFRSGGSRAKTKRPTPTFHHHLSAPEHCGIRRKTGLENAGGDRKSIRLNSSHSSISYAVFCWKRKNRHTEYYHLISSRQFLITITIQ